MTLGSVRRVCVSMLRMSDDASAPRAHAHVPAPAHMCPHPQNHQPKLDYWDHYRPREVVEKAGMAPI